MSWKFIQGQLLSSQIQHEKKSTKKEEEEGKESAREIDKYFMAMREGENWMIPAELKTKNQRDLWHLWVRKLGQSSSSLITPLSIILMLAAEDEKHDLHSNEGM